MACALEINSNGGSKRGHVESCPLTTKNKSPLPQCLWPPNFASWWLPTRDSHPKKHNTLIRWSCEITQQTKTIITLLAVYNLGQRVGDKLTKLSKVGFPMECFTADFLRFFTEKCQNLAFGQMSGYSTSNSSISAIFSKFPNFLRS